MTFAEPPVFDDPRREDLYAFVEQHGSVSPDEARSALGFDRRAFGHHLTILKRDGMLRETDGELQVALDPGVEEEHREGGVEVTIRSARPADLSGLVGAMRSVVADGYVEAESVADIVDHENVLLRHNELESRVFFVATVADEVVGWVHIRRPEAEKLQHTGELTVGVLAGYRGRGIGSHLLERGVSWASENGCEKLYNSVPATNEAAIDFLEERGWEIEAVRDDHYRIDGEAVDEVMLARRL